MVHAIRDNAPHLLLIGFPIPDKVGAPPMVMHWQAILLPVLSSGTKTVNGFLSGPRRKGRRENAPSNQQIIVGIPGKTGYWRNDRNVHFKDSNEINWINSENWQQSAILAREASSPEFRSMSVALIGAGALGSRIAELLVRMGTKEITIIDGDLLHAGNLARHVVDLTKVNQNKAKALSAWLNTLSPYVHVNYSSDEIGTAIRKGNPPIAQVILDCTGNDQVLAESARIQSEELRLYVSLSLSFSAKKMFCFASRAMAFPHKDFIEMTREILRKDATDHAAEELQWEGVGCWHPLFPARIDNIARLASMAIPWLEESATMGSQQPIFEVFEL